MPASCEQCGKTELDEENQPVIDLLNRYPVLIKFEGEKRVVNFEFARWVLQELAWKKPLLWLTRLEAFAQGLNQKPSAE